jgi:hypothetical protein
MDKEVLVRLKKALEHLEGKAASNQDLNCGDWIMIGMAIDVISDDLAKPEPERRILSNIITDVIRDICELPGRTSPEDWPEAMLIETDELRGILEQYFEGRNRDCMLSDARIIQVANTVKIPFGHGVYAYLKEFAEEIQSDMGRCEHQAKLLKVEKAINKYYMALDKREHGGIAQDRAFNEIQQALGMSWQQGEALTESGGEPTCTCLAVHPYYCQVHAA